jgi:VAD1 Analog of StAR-related lipid transfer domain/GRAM domain
MSQPPGTKPLHQLPQEEVTCTELLHTIFDRSVGACYGSFTCTYNRQHGRMYVSQTSILFYSHIFGFERRLCLPLTEVTTFKRYRTTSVWVTMMDGEEFIFKSLPDREVTVTVIQALLLRNTLPIVQSVETSDEQILMESSKIQITTKETASQSLGQTMFSVLQTPSRERTRSQSTDEPMNLHSVNSHEINDASTTIDIDTEVNTLEAMRKVSNADISLAATSSSSDGIWEAWNHEKQDQRSRFSQSPIVENLFLSCTLDDFWFKFLSDDAPHSIMAYQEKHMGDSQIVTTKWNTTMDNATMNRSITFSHPIKNALGVGPTSTMATRSQTLSRFGDLGLCLLSRTTVVGIPAADTFHVEECWFVEQVSSHEIHLTVLPEIVFVKRTMFKRMIESSTKSEILIWYKGFVAMLLEKTQLQSKRNTITPIPEEVKKANRYDPFQNVGIVIAIVFLFLALIGQSCILSFQFRQFQVQLDRIQDQQTLLLQYITKEMSNGTDVKMYKL